MSLFICIFALPLLWYWALCETPIRIVSYLFVCMNTLYNLFLKHLYVRYFLRKVFHMFTVSSQLSRLFKLLHTCSWLYMVFKDFSQNVSQECSSSFLSSVSIETIVISCILLLFKKRSVSSKLFLFLLIWLPWLFVLTDIQFHLAFANLSLVNDILYIRQGKWLLVIDS